MSGSMMTPIRASAGSPNTSTRKISDVVREATNRYLEAS
jgi:hypothetical protein